MLPALLLWASLVNDVRELINRHDLTAAERAARAYQTSSGATSEFAAALSWVARGELAAANYQEAGRLAEETRQLSLELLRKTKLDADPWLPTALGAAIEVHAQALAATGERGEALTFLREQLAAYGNTSLHERISKNINLIDLEGKPAPPLDTEEWFGPKPPSLASLRGRPVLLFFWAHWCPDCKAEIPILANVIKTYGPRGLVVIGPTKYYGYTARGEDAAPAVEKPYIERIRQQFYAPLLDMPAPLSARNFERYGASTVPTLVLIDGSGTVRFYHPGNVSESELAGRIQPLLSK